MSDILVLQIPSAPLPGSREPVPAVVAALRQALERAESGETVAYALVELSDAQTFRGNGYTGNTAETLMVLGGLAATTARFTALSSQPRPPTPRRGQDA